MSKSTIFKHALRSENWDEAARLVLVHPDLPLRKDARSQSFVSYAARDGRWVETEWLLKHGSCLSAALLGWVEHGARAPMNTEKLMFKRLDVLLNSEVQPVMTVFFNELTLRAIQACRADVVIVLLKKSGVPKTSAAWVKEWCEAIKRFNPDICEALRAANIHSFNDKTFMSDLGSKAIVNNTIEVLYWLASRGLDVNQCNSQGRTLLGLAAAMGREKMCLWLGGESVLVDLPNRAGHTALYEAVVHGHGACARELIRLGADPERRQGVKGQGDSPLRLASKENARDMRRILMVHLEQVVMSKNLPLLVKHKKISQRL